MARWLPLLVLVVLVAGCLAPETAPAAEPQDDLLLDVNRPDTEFGDVVTGPAVGPDLNATTAAPPRLVAGEWWRIQFASDLAGDDVEVVRVVADVGPTGYIFGMPHEGWFKEAIAFHAPAFGDVGLDLSYATHNVVFAPVKFPLVQGMTWETHFAASPFIATVEEADEFTATITFQPPPSDPDPTAPVMQAIGLSGPAGGMKVVFDARIHEVVRMESFAGTWEVVEHGYDFEGWVTVPRGEHTAIDYGTFGPAAPDQPILTRTIAVDGGFNRLTMMHVVGGATAGSYHIKSTTPNGTAFYTEAVGEASFVIKFYEATDPDGTWQQEDFVAGVGFTYSMGIAYHQYDIRLPDGLRRADHSHHVIR